jgi:hypothetical protein
MMENCSNYRLLSSKGIVQDLQECQTMLDLDRGSKKAKGLTVGLTKLILVLGQTTQKKKNQDTSKLLI